MKEKSLLEEKIAQRLEKERYKDEPERPVKTNKWNLLFIILLLLSSLLGLIYTLLNR